VPANGAFFNGGFMMKNVMIRTAAVMLTGLFASAAIAADQKPAQPVAVSGGAMQVAIYDPITKKLRAPTPEEAAKFAKSLDAKRALQAQLPNTSGRPRTEAESQKTARTVRVNGYTTVVVDTPETEFNQLIGLVDANGKLVIAHSAGDAAHATATEVTQ
jgi:hypothetical protein